MDYPYCGHLIRQMNFLHHPLFCLAIIIFIATCSGLTVLDTDCSFDIQTQLGTPQPLVLKPLLLTTNRSALNYESFLWPKDDSVVYLKNDEDALVACPGGILIISDRITKFSQAMVTCKDGNFFFNDEAIIFSKIQCSKLPSNIARFTGNSCLGDKREIEIGFELKPEQFIRMLTICFDVSNFSNSYASATLSKHIMGYQSHFPRPTFTQDHFYPFGVNSRYARKSQRATINELLGLPPTSTKYISDDLFLSRGHLIAKADFVYGVQQKATFHYVNVAPQWQNFNGGNWNTLEKNIRAYVSAIDSFDERFSLISGTHGVTSLPHEHTAEPVELYLYVEGTKRGIPVPQLYWRILRNEQTMKAVGFVGINNPYRSHVTAADIVCEDICDHITWLTWDAHNIKKGYSYCCTIEELRHSVSNIPQFDVKGLLV